MKAIFISRYTTQGNETTYTCPKYKHIGNETIFMTEYKHKAMKQYL